MGVTAKLLVSKLHEEVNQCNNNNSNGVEKVTVMWMQQNAKFLFFVLQTIRQI
ncbi:MAG: hypothetical protein ACI8RD_005809 [Bacillariaceae sp.]|jgi:hypothetical protein